MLRRSEKGTLPKRSHSHQVSNPCRWRETRVILLGLGVFISTLHAEAWNIPERTLRLWMNHSLTMVGNTLNTDGSIGPEISDGERYLQYTALNLTYSPIMRFHAKTAFYLEKLKDASGRAVPSSFGSSWSPYHLNAMRFDLHWGFKPSLETSGIGLYYALPVSDLQGNAHTFGFHTAANGKLNLGGFETTLTHTGELAFSTALTDIDSLNVLFLGKVESYTPLSVLSLTGFWNNLELHAGLEGVFSSWYYLKGFVGFYLVTGANLKWDLHYAYTALGKWVLPGHTVSLGVEVSLGY